MKSQKGFTLIEVMIALGIGLLIMAMVYEVFFQVEKTGRMADDDNAKTRRIRLVSDIVGADIRGAFVYRAGGRVAGLLAEPPSHGNVLMSFWTRSARSMGAGAAVHVWYRLVASPSDSRFALSREEHLGGSITRMTLMEGLLSADIRFYMQEGWQNEWRGSGNLPRAIEMTLVPAGRVASVKLVFPVYSQGS